MNHWNNQAWYHPGYAYPAGFAGWQHPTAHAARPPAWHEPKPDAHFSVDRFRTRKCPNLHPILSADTTHVRVDLRKKPPVDDMKSPPFYVYRHAQATEDCAPHIRLVSRDFPWSIDIKTKYNEPVTCDDIWKSLYSVLHHPVADSEWGMAVIDKDHAKKIEKAAKKRQETDKDKQLKRIDFLGESCIFRGLEKDDEFANRRTAFFDDSCSQTYIVKMAPS